MRPTTSADLPPAVRFLRDARTCEGPISGLRMLTFAGNHERATDCLRALEDRGDIRCTGPVVDCPKTQRGYLVGQRPKDAVIYYEDKPKGKLHTVKSPNITWNRKTNRVVTGRVEAHGG